MEYKYEIKVKEGSHSVSESYNNQPYKLGSDPLIDEHKKFNNELIKLLRKTSSNNFELETIINIS